MHNNLPSFSASHPSSTPRQPLVETLSQNTRWLNEQKDAMVLVVEDNVSNFVLIARMLGYMGIHCEWKTSGYEVVEYADTLPHLDLILLDIRLPYEDGFSALKKIRASHRLKNTLVIAVTAEASQEHLKRAQEAGFDGFLGKPLDPDRFPEQVRHILAHEPVWELS
jgi:two-component system cell cycle response regulator DivK